MSKISKHRHYSDKRAASKSSLIVKVPIVLLLMILSGLSFLAVATLFALRAPFPLSLTRSLSLVALYIAALIGGLVSAFKFDRPESYLCALISSAVLTLMILLMKSITEKPEASLSVGLSIVLHVMIVAICLAGAKTGERIIAARSRRHKTRR